MAEMGEEPPEPGGLAAAALVVRDDEGFPADPGPPGGRRERLGERKRMTAVAVAAGQLRLDVVEGGAGDMALR
jgi:hypothetical protein